MTTLHGNPVPPNFNNGEELSADAFNAVKNYWVTDELPETAENGDVVFVVESDPFDPNATPGLPGVGGWATITAVGGTVTQIPHTDSEGNDWISFRFLDDGTISTTDGVLDVLVVGDGGGGSSADGNNRAAGGGGGLHFARP